MKTKLQNFHNEIRKQKIIDVFQKKRMQLLKSCRQTQQYQFGSNQLNYQNSNELIETLQQNSQKIKQLIKTDNFQQIQQRAKDSFYKLKQLLNCKSKSIQRKNRIVQIWLAYKYDELLPQIVINSRYHMKSSLLKQLCKFVTLTFYQIFKHQSITNINFNRQLFALCIFICLDQLSSQQHMIRKIFSILNNLIFTVPQFRDQFYFYNVNQPKINIENIFSIMYKKKQWLSLQEYQQQSHQIKMFFFSFYRNYIHDLENLKKYSQNKQKFINIDKNNKQFSKIHEYQQILDVLQYPNSLRIQNKIIEQQNKLLVENILSNTLRYLLKIWNDNVNHELDLIDLIITRRTIYQFFENYQLQTAIQQADNLLSLIPVKFANDHVKNQIVLYLDIMIYIDHTNILTKRLINKHNLVPIILGYQNTQIDNSRVNILSNLLVIQMGKQSISKYLNQIVIYLDDNPNISKIQILNFIHKYFITINYNINSNDIVLTLLHRINRNFYTQKQVQEEVDLFTIMYNQNYQEDLPSIYYQWNKYNKFSQIINSLFDKVNILISQGLMQKQ